MSPEEWESFVCWTVTASYQHEAQASESTFGIHSLALRTGLGDHMILTFQARHDSRTDHDATAETAPPD